MKEKSVCRLVLMLTILAASALVLAQDQKSATIDCTGTAQACTKPAKFLSKTSGCVCFTCGYGTPASRQVCTKRTPEAKALAKMVQDSGFSDSNMDTAVAALEGDAAQKPKEAKPHFASEVLTDLNSAGL